MKKIYFIRHGESEGNAGDFWQTAETPLNETGIKQAEIMAKRISSINFDLLVSSSYVRAKQTAQFISKKTGKDILESDLFIERIRPSEQRNEKKDSEVGRLSREKYDKAFLDNQKYKDGESFRELFNRAKEALQFLDEQKAKNIVVVTHGMFLRVICAYVLLKEDLNPKNCFDVMMTLKTKNTGLTLIQKEEGLWRLNIWNDHAHFAEY